MTDGAAFYVKNQMSENAKKYYKFNLFTFSTTLGENGKMYSILRILRHLTPRRRIGENGRTPAECMASCTTLVPSLQKAAGAHSNGKQTYFLG